MKAEEARQTALKKRKKLVDDQLQNLQTIIKEAANRGEFVTRAHCALFSTSRDTGWLLEVIEKLREEGYNVSTYGEYNMYEKVFINWKPEVEPVKATNQEPILPVETPVGKEKSWWRNLW